jgi:hypothetical protein
LGRRRKIRISETDVEIARKKIKNTAKRGRWPKFYDIHRYDIEKYIELFLDKSKRIVHPKYNITVFKKILNRGDNVKDSLWDVYLPSTYATLGVIRFYCESWAGDNIPIIDTECTIRCERVSCPYYRKGFITKTLEDQTFSEDVTSELNEKHNKTQFESEMEYLEENR